MFITKYAITIRDLLNNFKFSPESSSFASMPSETAGKWTFEDFEKLAQSFQIKDFDLFVN